MKNLGWILLTFGLSYVVAVVGGWVTMPALGVWYAELLKPEFNPPNWVFGPVWSVLYTLMGLAGYLVVRDGLRGSLEKIGFGLHLAQLSLNLAWSFVFFGYQQVYNAMWVILALWFVVACCVVCYWQRSRWAGGLMVPYLLWISFAGVLNFAIWRLN
jgi:tryptophan-rich sensory protein